MMISESRRISAKPEFLEACSPAESTDGAVDISQVSSLGPDPAELPGEGDLVRLLPGHVSLLDAFPHQLRHRLASLPQGGCGGPAEQPRVDPSIHARGRPPGGAGDSSSGVSLVVLSLQAAGDLEDDNARGHQGALGGGAMTAPLRSSKCLLPLRYAPAIRLSA